MAPGMSMMEMAPSMAMGAGMGMAPGPSMAKKMVSQTCHLAYAAPELILMPFYPLIVLQPCQPAAS